MKNFYICMLALGLTSVVSQAAEVKQRAAQTHKYNDAATLALVDAFKKLDVDGAITALNNGANPNGRIGTKSYRHPGGVRVFEHFVSSNLKDTACLYYLIYNAVRKTPNTLLASNVTVEKALTTILDAVIAHDGNINIDLHDVGNHGSPLHLAASEGTPESQLSVMKALLNAGADINNQMQISESTPIQIAAFDGEIDAFRFLLYNGADTTVRNKNNYDLNYLISVRNSPERQAALRQILDEYKKAARQAVQREASPYITRDPADIAADFLVGENPEITAIHKSKEPKEEPEDVE